MKKSTKNTVPLRPIESHPSQTTSSRIAACCFGIATLLAIYLGWTSWRETPVAGCGQSASCTSLLTTQWGYFAGLPVGVWGALLYLANLIVFLFASNHASAWGRFLAWTVLGGALWFIIVQAVILQAFCAWCCVTHVVASLGAWIRLRTQLQKPSDSSSLPWQGAVGCLFIFAGLQAIGSDRVRPSTRLVSLSTNTNRLVNQLANPSNSRIWSDPSGQFQFVAEEFPVAGPVNATQLLAVVADFTCDHCRQLERDLPFAIRAFPSNQLAVLLLPGTRSKVSGSTEIQRLMLTVWREKPDAWEELSKRLVTDQLSPTPQSLFPEIANLIGSSNSVTRALERHEPWVNQQIQKVQQLLSNHVATAGTDSLPQLLSEKSVLVGAPDSIGSLIGMLGHLSGLPITTAPRLEWIPREIQMGSKQPGSSTLVRISLNNRGNEVLKISGLRMPPNTHVKSPPPNQMDPGQSGFLELQLTHPTAPGPFAQTIEILSNAVSESAPEIIVRGTIGQ